MFNNDVKIAFFGSSKFSVIVLKELKKLGIIPEIIITTLDKPQGRRMVVMPTPTKIWAEENSIEYLAQSKLKDPEFLKKLSEYNLFLVASYGRIIPKEILEIPKYKILNIHPSLLPKYRGPSPLQQQILNNEKDIGVSIMEMDEEIDHGPILAQKKVEIENWPVSFTVLEDILAKEGALLLKENLEDWISGKKKTEKQEHNKATFTKKIEKTDGLIKLDSENQLKNYLKTLAFEEWPKTFFEVERKGKKGKVTIKKAEWKNDIFEILKVIPEGKREMDYKSFLLGF